MYWNRFDICEAYYIFLSENHGGQSSKMYSRLSNMLAYFTPRPTLTRDTLSENAQMILEDLESQDNK
ncbi:MAG: hypothetical protein ACRCU2_13100 [Planktothrix sp.]